jgi:diaminopimelate decarboxylase
MSDTVLEWVAAQGDRLPTPCYVYDEAELQRAYDSLSALFPRAHVLYSMKANPQPALIGCLHGRGAGAEIGSEAEYRAARSAGVPPAKIVVGGISRTRDFVAAACAEGAGAFVIESRRDLELIPDRSPVPVLVRVRPPLGEGVRVDPAGWFGLALPEAVEVVRELEKRGLRFAGVHFHAGTQKLDARLVAEAVDRLAAGLQKLADLGIRPQIVNFGPGLGVPYRADDRPLDEQALAPVFARLRGAAGDATFWVEAGRRLVAAAGLYVTRVVNVKCIDGKPHVFVDGGINVHNPGIGLGRIMHANPRFVFPGAASATSIVQLAGSLCTSADLLGRDVPAPELREGALVAVTNSGAYCATSGMWGFNSRPLFAEILLGGDGRAVTLEPQHARLHADGGAS